MNTLALLLMTATFTVAEPGLKATAPTRDLIDLATIVSRDSKTDWSDYRVLTFSHLAGAERERLQGDVRFVIETLNRRTRRAEIRPLTDALWAVNVAELNWGAADWNAMARKWPYFAGVPEQASKYLRARFAADNPVMRADAFLHDAWQPEWYTKLLDLPTKREKLLAEFSIDADFASQIVAIGVVPESGVQTNPRKVAYLRGRSGANDRDVFITMNYENRRGKNDSLRHPTQIDCSYNEIAIEAPNGIDFYYANAGGGGVAQQERITDELVDRVGNSDSRMAGLVKQIPLSAGLDHVHGGQLLLGMSCVGCHSSGAQDLADRLAPTSQLRFTSAKITPARRDELFDNGELVDRARLASRRWQRALRSINGRTPEENQRSWQASLAAFAAPVDLAQAAVELGATTEVLVAAIRQEAGDNHDPLVAALLERPLSREEFEQVYATLRSCWRSTDDRTVATAFATRAIR